MGAVDGDGELELACCWREEPHLVLPLCGAALSQPHVLGFLNEIAGDVQPFARQQLGGVAGGVAEEQGQGDPLGGCDPALERCLELRRLGARCGATHAHPAAACHERIITPEKHIDEPAAHRLPLDQIAAVAEVGHVWWRRRRLKHELVHRRIRRLERQCDRECMRVSACIPKGVSRPQHRLLPRTRLCAS
jgi:hypothetical protein|tara:strand:+ start:1317 stop:1889 length:573 start_codon:yes stop_codon:yes gene_type:complete